MLSTLLPAPAELGLFVAAVFLLNATPGVDFLLTIGRTLAGGFRAGAAAAAGIGAGCLVHAAGAAFGLAALLALAPQAFVAVQWAGAAYLAWVGIGLLRQAWCGGAAEARPQGEPASPWADFRSGLLTNVLNPKVALFFLAFLPQFVPAASAHKSLSLLLLGGAFAVQSTVFLSTVSFVVSAVAGRLSRWQTPGAATRTLKGLGGGLFIVLALRLLGERPATA